MKHLTTIIMLSIALTGTAFASEHGMGGNMMSGDSSMDRMGGGMMMGMMSHDQMMAMHEHMEQMQSLMGKIRSEKDGTKRHNMLREHMHSMQGGMQMMSGEKNAPGKMGRMDADARMQMMQERMDMMQMMMGQMMEHMQMMEGMGTMHDNGRDKP